VEERRESVCKSDKTILDVDWRLPCLHVLVQTGNSAVLHKEGGVTLAEASENAMQSNAGTRRLVKRPANKSPFRIGTSQLLSCKHVLAILFVLLGCEYCLHVLVILFLLPGCECC
jgi:hypothetical protein